MKYKLPILAVLMMTPVCSCLHAQTADAPPVNVNAVLTTLNQARQKYQTDIKSTETALAQTFMNNASDPATATAYYINAVIATQFNGLTHEAKEIQDWKKRHEADFRDANFKNALCLHLMYLSLTLSHDAGVKTKDLLQSLLTYTQQVEANETGLAGQVELMGTPLSKSIFVRALGIDQYVTDNATWELIPINVDGIFNKVILPEYRSTKNATGIFQYWDDRIKREEAAVQGLRPLDVDKFKNVTKPGLLWLRAQEYLGLGQRNNAINSMVQIIKDNPYHPDAPSWIEEVEKLVKTPAAAAPVPAPAQAAAPPALPDAPVATSPGNTQPAQN